MKRRSLVCFLLVALTMPAAALVAATKGPITLRVPMTTVVAPVTQPAPQPVPLVVPVGEIAEITVVEMTPELARLCDTTIYPRPAGLWIRKVTDWENRNYTIQLRSPIAAKFLVKIVSPGATANDPVQAAEVELTVGEPMPPVGAPVITSPLSSAGAVGVAYTYAIAATNNPTSFQAVGLLDGLVLDTTTGLVSGTPTAAGTSAVRLSATNAQGTGTATLALTISDAPPPPPPPVVQTIQVITVEETADSTPERARIRNSAALRNWAENGGHAIYFIDQDAVPTGPNAARWQSWLDRGRQRGVPITFITPAGDGQTILAEVPQPETEAAFLTLVQQYGGKGETCRLDAAGNRVSCPIVGGSK